MSNNSKVLALKYRPQTFDQLVGQEVIAESIYNSIKNDKIPNAYLFLGIRGTGKTSLARIVAKALNCKNGVDNLCKKDFCESCQSIIAGNNIDIIEVDGASSTSVSNIKEIIESSKYKPTSARYKIYIIDEVHMISSSAFAALLKTLEEPSPHLKFIFASTEVKKIPVTIISRCQRYDLSRVNSEELFNYLLKIKDLENGKITNDVIKLIVKLSEGSVRDSLSLLDRALISNNGKELDLKNAQKIFGYFEKSIIIDLISHIIEGDEESTIKLYKSIYKSGVEPKIFLNEFLETIYYIKNIDFINLDGSNFDLNDQEFEKIKSLSKKIIRKDLLLLWQFTLNNLEKIDIIKNQYQFVEMFLIRSLYIKKILKDEKNLKLEKVKQNLNFDVTKKVESKTQANLEAIDQLKSIDQEEKVLTTPEVKNKIEGIEINDLKDLISVCEDNKEAKIKYELENNLRLVSFKNQKIEISFNSNLEKSFVKELSAKLLEWTNKRWIIAFSKEDGLPTIKEQKKNLNENLLKKELETQFSKEVRKIFADAELVKVEEEK